MFRLRSKILLAFSLVILTGMILMVTIINFTTRSGYESFAKQNDIDICLYLSGPLSEYYSFQGNWDGVETLLNLPQLGMGQMRGGMNRKADDNGPRFRMMVPHFILADSMGNVLVNTGENRDEDVEVLSGKILESGVKIFSGKKIIAYLFAGSMIKTNLNENEQKFLNRTMIIIVSVSLFILFISIIFSYFFSWRLTRPVDALTSAAREVKAGNYNQRVSVAGKDELSDLSRSFNQMVDSLENNDKWRKQIIADSAHELRTPVSLIQGNLEMILDGVYQADTAHLQNIYDETLVLSRLIKELQELSSAESGSMFLNMEELNLNTLIGNVSDLFRVGELKDKINLNNLIEDELPLIQGDYQKLKQVFSNVLANAFRHTPEGGSVQVRAEVKKSSVLIVIEDTGPGIKEEELEKIFERFYRTDSSRNRVSGGSGLGLSISREIIKLHGGSIYAQSKNDSGASIFISLPF